MSSTDLPDLSRIRTEYATTGLSDEAAPADPIELFSEWFTQAREAGVLEPNAMVLSTVGDPVGADSRMVLLKGLEDGCFQFYTNLGSTKAQQLRTHPECALLFPWYQLQRQVRINGTASLIPRAEVECYFDQRPRAAQLGAWASQQSTPIESREALDQQYAAIESRFPDIPVPCPDFWGGYSVRPHSVEFWHGRLNRLHDRISYQLGAAGWTRQRLQP